MLLHQVGRSPKFVYSIFEVCLFDRRYIRCLFDPIYPIDPAVGEDRVRFDSIRFDSIGFDWVDSDVDVDVDVDSDVDSVDSI